MSETAPNSGVPPIDLRNVAVTEMRNLETTVAEEVNWTINAGEFWLVAGPQGAGKGSLIFLLGGLMPPASGTYRFFGEAMPIFEEERLAQRLRLGLVFENGRLFSRMSIAENVALPLQYHHELSREEIAARVQAMLELTELTPFANQAPASLSRNWQKRAGLARALVLQPEVLLLNNPLAGLDARHTHWTMNFLGQLSAGQVAGQKQRMTIVAATDDLSPASGWRAQARHIAYLARKRLAIFHNWQELDRCPEADMRDLLDTALLDR